MCRLQLGYRDEIYLSVSLYAEGYPRLWLLNSTKTIAVHSSDNASSSASAVHGNRVVSTAACDRCVEDCDFGTVA